MRRINGDDWFSIYDGMSGSSTLGLVEINPEGDMREFSVVNTNQD